MKCPICGKPVERAVRPFCSRRCADIDLGKWISGAYAIPSREPEDAERAAEEVARLAEDRGENAPNALDRPKNLP